MGKAGGGANPKKLRKDAKAAVKTAAADGAPRPKKKQPNLMLARVVLWAVALGYMYMKKRQAAAAGVETSGGPLSRLAAKVFGTRGADPPSTYGDGVADAAAAPAETAPAEAAPPAEAAAAAAPVADSELSEFD